MSSKDNRKLAAIMFADIVGYSRMMAGNEERTLELLKDFENICSSIIAENNGVIIKKVGDELFCEFSSAKDAVDSALEIQKAIQPYNDSRPKDFKLQVRIGIHIGDVLKRDDDVFGDGVNVASRIQPFAKPGGICVSNAVRDAISSHPSYKIQSEGQQELKNIVEKHTLYRVETGFETISQKKSFNKTGSHYFKKWVAPILLIAIITTYILYNNKSPIDKINDTFLIHIKSSDQQNLKEDINEWAKSTAITVFNNFKEIDNNIMSQVRNNIIPKLNSEVTNSDINVYYTQNEEEYRMMNKLPLYRSDFHWWKSDYRDSIPELKEEYELKHSEINQSFDYFNNLYDRHIDVYISVDIFEYLDENNDYRVKIFPTTYTDSNRQYINMGFYGQCNNCDLKLDKNNLEDIYDETVNALEYILNEERFGGPHIGQVNEILDSDLISIYLDDNKINKIVKGMIFTGIRVYTYPHGEVTLNKWIDDRNIILNYYDTHSDKLEELRNIEDWRPTIWYRDAQNIDELLLILKNEIDSLHKNRDEVIKHWKQKNNRVWDNMMEYEVEIIKVSGKEAIGKIIHKKNDYVIPKKTDEIWLWD